MPMAQLLHTGMSLPLLLAMACLSLALSAAATVAADQADEPALSRRGRPIHTHKVAVIATVYHHNSHADIIASRLLQTDTLDGKGHDSPLEMVSLYVDQKHPRDISPMLAASHRFPITSTIEEALTLGTGKLAVDGVLLIPEHGDYPKSETGNTQYPKRRFWDETIKVFRASGRVVPVFMDKHVADNWEDIEHIYNEARAMNIPIMAGSSLPGSWRKPAVAVTPGADIEEIVAISFHTLDHYGFHALEYAQAVAEERDGGERGVRAVQTTSGDAVWKALDEGLVSRELFDAAWKALPRHLIGNRGLREVVREPVLFTIEHVDGLKVHVFTLNPAVGEWSGAWREGDGTVKACQFFTQEGRPGMHFTWLLEGVEDMILTGEPAWPVERTVITSAVLDRLLQSRLRSGERLMTPYLERMSYDHPWRWQSPPDPPVTRPWAGQ